jgi:hypothetical protein
MTATGLISLKLCLSNEIHMSLLRSENRFLYLGYKHFAPLERNPGSEK